MNDAAKPAIWVTGAAGLIGNYICQSAPELAGRWRVLGLTRADLDLSQAGAVRQRFQRDQPQGVIHCAALSRSPVCQANPGLARQLNVEVTRVLADLAVEIRFIFISSDLVFDGQQGNYDESALPNPLSVYGETKVLAEKLVLANPKHIVLRTSLNGGISPAGNRSFNEEMRLAWERGEPVKLFVDEFRSPLPGKITARAVWELVEKGSPGIYHLGGRERLSRWEIGRWVARRWPDLHPKILPASIRDYKGGARPPDTSLNSTKIQRLLSFPLPGLREWLEANPGEPF